MITCAHILAWADAHHRRTGRWPVTASGPVTAGPLGLSWRALDNALRLGFRGLEGGSSLARLLAEYRHIRNLHQLPRLSRQQILDWADAHRKRTGAWPTAKAGPIVGGPGETWRALDSALRLGLRDLEGCSSLAQLLAEARALGVRNRTSLPALTAAQIVGWATAHHRRTGEWPTRESGAIEAVADETWHGVDLALRCGYRGLPGGSSVGRLLRAYREGPGRPAAWP